MGANEQERNARSTARVLRSFANQVGRLDSPGALRAMLALEVAAQLFETDEPPSEAGTLALLDVILAGVAQLLGDVPN